MAKQPAKAAFDLGGYRSAPSFGRPNMRRMLRTGGPRAPGLTLAPSAKVFPVTGYDRLGGVFQGTKPLIYQQRNEVQSPLTLLAVETPFAPNFFVISASFSFSAKYGSFDYGSSFDGYPSFLQAHALNTRRKTAHGSESVLLRSTDPVRPATA